MELKGPDTLNQRIARNISDVKRWVNILKYIHDTLLFGAATLSAGAAVILKLDSVSNEALRRDIASVLAAVSALMGVIAASGAFERKWQAFRWTHHRLLELEIDLTPENCNSQEIKDRYKTIWREHEKEIGGTEK